MVKGPDAETFLIDVFRVTGGEKHAFRIFSEIGASDAEDDGIEFAGVEMPPERPIPDFGGSIEDAHIYGLRDVRGSDDPKPGWQATWEGNGRSYRLTMLSGVDRVEASHGPGQEEYLGQFGRRVRYVDSINKGKDTRSTFIALHEPSSKDGSFPVTSARSISLPEETGRDAVAVALETKWGQFVLLSGFEKEGKVATIRFRGAFGLVRVDEDGARHIIACGANTLMAGSAGFENETASWEGAVTSSTRSRFTSSSAAPKGFPAVPSGCQCYVLVEQGKYMTGYGVDNISGRRVGVRRFGLNSPVRFELPALRVLQE
jgi:hypothetical protein